MSIGSDIKDRRLEEVASPHHNIFPSAVVPYLLSTADAFVIVASSIIGAFFYHWLMGLSSPNVLADCAVGLLASFMHILRLSGSGYYEFPDCAKPRLELSAILISWFSTGLLLAFFAVLLKLDVTYSRGSFIVFFFVTPVGLLVVRKLTKVTLMRAVAKGSIGRRDIALVGDFTEIAALDPQDMLTFFGAADVMQFTLSRDDDPLTRASNDTRILNGVANFVRRNNCREILLALPWGDAGRMEFVRDYVKTLPVAVRLLPDMRARSISDYSSSARQLVLSIEIQRAPLTGIERSVKRIMDVVIASIALVFFLPVMLVTALAIKLDGPGPIIFRQNRKGFNGNQFAMLKFRTMTVQENGAVVSQATRDDPRTTPIGRLLRSASIDELPQLVNVLRGDMSLIGPRPHALAHDSHFEELLSNYAFRHHVKPGMTGWAQCNGARGATPTIEHVSERVRLDLWYINNWSLWLDIQILIRTAFEVLRKRNAY